MRQERFERDGRGEMRGMVGERVGRSRIVSEEGRSGNVGREVGRHEEGRRGRPREERRERYSLSWRNQVRKLAHFNSTIHRPVMYSH